MYESGRGLSGGESKRQMRGSLHCATGGETVRGFGRDDAAEVEFVCEWLGLS